MLPPLTNVLSHWFAKIYKLPATSALQRRLVEHAHRHNAGPAADQRRQPDRPAATWYHLSVNEAQHRCPVWFVLVMHVLDEVSGWDQPSGDDGSHVFIALGSAYTRARALDHMHPIITTFPSGSWGDKETNTFCFLCALTSKHAHIVRAHPCSLAMRWNSLSSLPLKPFAKGLFSIFSCVIWEQNRENIEKTYKRIKSSNVHWLKLNLIHKQGDTNAFCFSTVLSLIKS